MRASRAGLRLFVVAVLGIELLVQPATLVAADPTLSADPVGVIPPAPRTQVPTPIRSGSTYWYQPDSLGSVRLLTDPSGDTPATYSYSAFGSTRAETGSLPNEIRFSGDRTDSESGLEFLRARTYDPSTGTFLQRDSWGITPTSSQSLDLYLYTENDPANRTDHTGRWFGIDDAIASGIGAVGGGVITLGTDLISGQG